LARAHAHKLLRICCIRDGPILRQPALLAYHIDFGQQNSHIMKTATFDDVTAAAAGLQGEGQPVTVEAVHSALGGGSLSAIVKHLQAWRAEHVKPAEPAKAVLPESLLADLASWAQQYAEHAGGAKRDALAQSEQDMDALLNAGTQLEAERDELLAGIATAKIEREELDERIERLSAELRNARQVAADALVGKAKDQLAIEGKDAQIADLRAQVERYMATASADSDAKLAAQMELVGATTARDNLSAELQELRAQLETARADRSALRAEVQSLKAGK
jgi:chaperonin cofactor prefoldin